MSYPTATPRIASYVIMRKNGKIAFVMREDAGWMNGYYGLPSGKVENNESYLQAAVREAKEETGVLIVIEDLTPVHMMHRMEGTDWVDAYFEASKWQGEPINAELHKHSSLDWLDPKNLPKNVIPPVAFAIKNINNGIQYSEYGWKA